MRTFCISAVIAAMVVGSAIGVSGQDEARLDPTPSLEMQAIEGRHSATLLQDGSVLLVGGTGESGEPTGAAEIYDPATRSFAPVGSLAHPRDFHTATLLSDGRVAIVGGVRADSFAGKPVAHVEVYDPETRQFSVQGRLKRPRYSHSALLLDDGRVLVVGGMGSSAEGSRPIAAIEAYDPASRQSVRIGRLRKPRWDHDAFVLPDGRVLVIGLVLSGDPAWMDSRVLVEVFDPGRAGRSQRLPHQGLDLQGRTGAQLADDRILLVGGLRPAVLFDPATERFTETDRSATVGSGESVTLLDDGRVLVLGGQELGRATIELFDPATERFEQVGELHSTRSGQQATRLADGTVLISGGYGYEGPLGSAELFDQDLLDVVAYGPVPAAEASAPTPMPVPVEAGLGSIRKGGVVKMPGSGFRLKLPRQWSIETLEPDRDYRAAEPGDAWIALRATSPDGVRGCTVAVGVVPEANDLELEVDMDETVAEAYWQGRRRLMVPRPQLEPLGYGFGGVTGNWERRAKNDDALDHDVTYGLACLSAGEDMPDAAFRTFRLLPAESRDGSGGKAPMKRAAPASRAPLPALGATVDGGRVERTRSGFALTVPREWTVKVADPDPGVYAAKPGDAWEALRAFAPDRRRACSVHVGVVPLEAGSVGESITVESDEDAVRPYWSVGGKPTLLVPPARFRQRSDSATEGVLGWPRLRADDAGLPNDVVYAVVCGSDGERDPWGITGSLEILGRER